MAMPNQTTEKCLWGLHCPICKNEEEHREEDWDGDLQNQPRMHPQYFQHPQPQPQPPTTATSTKLPVPPTTEQPAIIQHSGQVF